jgi:hypothetical protein
VNDRFRDSRLPRGQAGFRCGMDSGKAGSKDSGRKSCRKVNGEKARRRRNGLISRSRMNGALARMADRKRAANARLRSRRPELIEIKVFRLLNHARRELHFARPISVLWRGKSWGFSCPFLHLASFFISNMKTPHGSVSLFQAEVMSHQRLSESRTESSAPLGCATFSGVRWKQNAARATVGDAGDIRQP